MRIFHAGVTSKYMNVSSLRLLANHRMDEARVGEKTQWLGEIMNEGAIYTR